MGDRVSIRFVKSDNEEWQRYSVVLNSHWGGTELPHYARAYVERLKAENSENSQVYPLDRLEPNIVMVDFIRELTEGKGRVKSNYRLYPEPGIGDDSDNGHHEIELA